MTAMPQLVSVLNAVGGGAAALIALADALHHEGSVPLAQVPVSTTLATFLDLLIGGVTFSGSVVAAGKLAGRIAGRPIVFRGGHWVNLGLFVVALACGLTYTARRGGVPVLIVLLLAALALGVLGTLPIGGADMPVVISLLNACTGTAVAMAGFVLESTPLIIAGGAGRRGRRHPHQADGRRDEPLAAEHRRRRVRHRRRRRAAGARRGRHGPGGQPGRRRPAAGVRVQGRDRPGYGLAAAQAQHELVALAQALDEHGVDVSYGIHRSPAGCPGT
jgi:NAD(P) transhydrogenase subunit beta